jgi:hypothetical protein
MYRLEFSNRGGLNGHALNMRIRYHMIRATAPSLPDNRRP